MNSHPAQNGNAMTRRSAQPNNHWRRVCHDTSPGAADQRKQTYTHSETSPTQKERFAHVCASPRGQEKTRSGKRTPRSSASPEKTQSWNRVKKDEKQSCLMHQQLDSTPEQHHAPHGDHPAKREQDTRHQNARTESRTQKPRKLQRRLEFLVQKILAARPATLCACRASRSTAAIAGGTKENASQPGPNTLKFV